MKYARRIKHCRQELIRAVMLQIESEIEDVIASLRNPTPFLRQRILGEILPNARYNLDRLWLEQLRDQQIIEGIVHNAVESARYLVGRINAQNDTRATDKMATEPQPVVCPDCNGSGASDLWSAGAQCERCGGIGTISLH